VVGDIIALYQNRSDMTAISAEAEHPDVYNKAVKDYGSWRGALKAAKAKCERMRAIEKDEWTFPNYKTSGSSEELTANADADNPTNSSQDLL